MIRSASPSIAEPKVMAEQPMRSYHRTTIYITEEQWRYLSRIAAQAKLDGLALFGE
jgi:hypothetical protein